MFKKLIPFVITAAVALTSCSKDEDKTPSSGGGGGGGSIGETVQDIDSNKYNVVQIGTQKWMKENLRTTKYRSGNTIPNPTGSWSNQNSGAWAYCNGSANTNSTYGKLYNFYAVTSAEGLCPSGWRVPNINDWKNLIKYLDAGADTVFSDNMTLSEIAGGKLKTTSQVAWLTPTNASDSDGFSAYPGGTRDTSGASSGFRSNGLWWASVSRSNIDAASFYLEDENTGVIAIESDKKAGLSVRCIKE